MTTPNFQPSDEFVYGERLPCLVSYLPNSIIPRLGERYGVADFSIFLRGKENNISPWQQEILNRLFQKEELQNAIQEGMREYETKFRSVLTASEEAVWEDIRHNGVLPHVKLKSVVIDDIKREVILWLVSNADGNLEEHGIVIHLKRDRWRFDDLDYLVKYCEDL